MRVGRPVVVLVACIACGSHAPPKPVAAPSDPRVVRGDVTQLDKRESAPMGTRAFTIGKLSGAVESATDIASNATDEYTEIGISIGSREYMHCFVYPHALDGGGALVKFMHALPKTLDFQLVMPTDVVRVGEHVALFVEAHYLFDSSDGKAAGLLKLGVYPDFDMPLFCFHDEVGYHQTFERVMTGLATSLKLAGAQPTPSRFVSIDVDKLEGRPVGYSRTEVFDATDGGKIYRFVSTLLLPRAPAELSASDEARTEVWDRDGYVTSITHAEGDGGELTEQFVLKRAGPHDYSYEGTHQGKKLSGKLTTKNPRGFEADWRFYASVKKLIATGGELRHEGYQPGVDPTSPVESVYRAASAGTRTLTIEFGKMTSTETVDAEGLSERGEMHFGAAKATTERVFVRGSM